MIKHGNHWSLGAAAITAGANQSFDFTSVVSSGLNTVKVTAATGGTFRLSVSGTAPDATAANLNVSVGGFVNGGSEPFYFRNGFRVVNITALSADLTNVMVTVSAGVTESTAPTAS